MLGRFSQAVDNLMPGFDKEIAKMAQRILINPRNIDWRTGVLATKVTPGRDSLLQLVKSPIMQSNISTDISKV